MKILVCPKIVDLDPSAEGFDGGGHTVCVTDSERPVLCQEVEPEGGRACSEELVEASAEWVAFLAPE